MPTTAELINECKQRIRYRAAWAHIEFLDSDLIVARADYATTVALRRQFLGHEVDENGTLILDEHSKPIPMFKDLMWLELSPLYLRMLTPWLVFVILGDEVFEADKDRFGLS